MFAERKFHDIPECHICHRPFKSQNKWSKACPNCKEENIRRYRQKIRKESITESICIRCKQPFTYSKLSRRKKEEICFSCTMETRKAQKPFLQSPSKSKREEAIRILESGIGNTITDQELLNLGFMPHEISKMREDNPDIMFQESSYYRSDGGAEYLGSFNRRVGKGVSIFPELDRCRDLINIGG